MRVGILGGGQWGQALARLVMAAGNEPLVAYRGARPPHVIPSSDDPPAVAAQCDLLLVATGSERTREAIRLARPGPGNRVVIAGRGVEPATGAWLTDVITDECDAVRVGALAGPAPASEILNGGLAAGVVASRYEEVQVLVTRALHSTRYRVYGSSDLTGVLLAGAAMPVLATILGLATTLRGAGIGMHAMVLARGLEELSRLGQATGADPATFLGLAGIGDLVAAQAIPGNPYFEAGVALARSEDSAGPRHLVEALLRLSDRHGEELPLTRALAGIMNGDDPLDAVSRLMARAPSSEHRS